MIEYDRFSHLFTHIWPYLPLSRGIVQEGEERIYSFTCQLLPSQAPKSTATGGAPWPPRSSTADLAAPPREACLGEQMAGSMPHSIHAGEPRGCGERARYGAVGRGHGAGLRDVARGAVRGCRLWRCGAVGDRRGASRWQWGPARSGSPSCRSTSSARRAPPGRSASSPRSSSGPASPAASSSTTPATAPPCPSIAAPSRRSVPSPLRPPGRQAGRKAGASHYSSACSLLCSSAFVLPSICSFSQQTNTI